VLNRRAIVTQLHIFCPQNVDSMLYAPTKYAPSDKRFSGRFTCPGGKWRDMMVLHNRLASKRPRKAKVRALPRSGESPVPAKIFVYGR
jgi:hypothetical protein